MRICSGATWLALSHLPCSHLNLQQSLAWIQQWTSRLVVDTDKLCDLLDEKTDIVDAPDAIEMLDCKGAIEFSDGKYH